MTSINNITLSTSNEESNHFEGPEKILEIEFNFQENQNFNQEDGLRMITRNKWDEILTKAKCEILSKKSSESLDSYVLSESSLFVYRDKIEIKTCGTTTLLMALNPVLEEALKLGLHCSWIGYSRKDFKFPHHQNFPHKSFSQEVEFLKIVTNKLNLRSSAFVLGDVCGDHYNVFLAHNDAPVREKCSLTLMMYGLDLAASQIYHKNNLNELGSEPQDEVEARSSGQIVREFTGLDSITEFEGPSVLFDDAVFDPCGYSLNTLNASSFFTVHVTPEQHCCYASFETNLLMNSSVCENMINQVLEIFKPRKFTVTVFADKKSLKKLDRTAIDMTHIKNEVRFERISKSTTTFATDFICQLANFERVE